MLQLQHDRTESTEILKDDEGEGVAIASLIGTDECSIVGWVYRWNTGAHAVMWKENGARAVSGARPELKDEQKQEIDFDALPRIGKGEVG